MKREYLESTRELLDHVLGQRSLNEEDLQIIIKKFGQESALHDFKSALLADDKHGGLKLRQTIASFANSDGGLLFVGIDEPGEGMGRSISPQRPKMSESLLSWASNALGQESSSYSPPPVILPIDTSAGDVLCIGIARAHDFVRVKNEVWLRFGDSSRLAPEYLISDLLLGRRMRPDLTLEIDLRDGAEQGGGQFGMTTKSVFVTATVRNLSLVWADDVRVGFISQTLDHNRDASIPRALERYVSRPATNYAFDWRVMHELAAPTRSGVGEFPTLGPFEHASVTVPVFLPWPQRAEWKSVAYVLARNAMPRWFQLLVTVNGSSRGWGLGEVRERLPELGWRRIE